MVRSAAASILSLVMTGVPAFAADAADERLALAGAVAKSTSGTSLVGETPWQVRAVPARAESERPRALLALYVSHAGLQAFDAYSTTQGLARGARETNPLMRGVVASPAALWGVKAATTALPILLTERLWRTNRTAAIVTMIAANSLAATVAANNARVLRQQR